MLKYVFIALFSFATLPAIAQTATPSDSSIFTRITKELGTFKPDTTTVSEDATTQKVRELRALKGGFNISEAISYKLMEDSAKGDLSPADYKAMVTYFKGQGNTWLENAVVRIYKQHFTDAELDELLRFYRTPAGQKLAADYPLIMVKCMAAAELVKTAAPRQKVNAKNKK